MDAYRLLIHGIINLAELDLANARARLNKNPDDKRARAMLDDVSEFFDSDWGYALLRETYWYGGDA